MKFYFPQWQGSGNSKDIFIGAQTLKDYLNDPDVITVPLSKKELRKKNDINAYDALVEQLSTFKQMLFQHKPKTIETIGGDCGLEIIPVSYLSSLYKNFGVIWFDAHSDINLPKESPSHNFHGMPLRTLIDEGDAIMKGLLFSAIKPSQIHYIGLRDIDSLEQDIIVKHHIYAPLTLNIEHLVSTLKKKKITHLYLHFDLDCLDPESFDKTYYKVSNGLSINEAQDCLMELKTNFKIAGSSILESVAATKKDLEPIKHLINLIMYD